LGLATVQQVVEERGGAIDVQSAAGQGTTFDVYLPLCADPGIGRDSLIRVR
jgi:signal transduction histidine kinase